MRRWSSIWLFFALVFIVPATVFGIVLWYQKNMSKLPVYYSSVDRNYREISFTNQNKKVITISDWDGKIVVADFFFTHCGSICPKMSRSMLEVQRTFRHDDKISLNSFSVDPERDSASQLKVYGDGLGIDDFNWNLLTGDKKEIYRLARNAFRVVVTDGDGGPSDFIHTEKLVLLDKEKRVRGYYDGTSPQDVKQLIKDIKKLRYEN